MTSCNVCCESFNKSNHKQIQCSYCTYEVCSGCTEEYLLSNTQDPHCMSCRKAWSRDFIDRSFKKAFVNDRYKKHRENVLIDREKSLLPATMPMVESTLLKKKWTENITELLNERKTLNELWKEMLYSQTLRMERIERLERQCDIELKLQTNKILVKYQRMKIYAAQWVNNVNNVNETERRKFIRACPAVDCRGFLSTQWKCGLCEIWVCPDCHEIKGANKDAPHTCKTENIESAKLIEKDTRPCPSCASLIYKVQGCDQMFCVQCHTAFSWRSGKIETGKIHNPHYYELMRKNGNGLPLAREIGDYECGGVPDWFVLSRKVKAVWGEYPATELRSIVRMHPHIDQVEIVRYRTNQVDDNVDLRIMYLTNEIDENKLKQSLQQREKARHKKRDITFVISMYQTAMADMLRRMQHVKSQENAKEVWNEILNLRTYTNDCMDVVSKRYNCKVPYISLSWTMTSGRDDIIIP